MNKLEQSSVKERLLFFINSKNISQRVFEERCGLSNGYINNIRKSIKPETFDKKIAPNFPELNKLWLLHNEGEMLNNNDVNQTINNQLSKIQFKSQKGNSIVIPPESINNYFKPVPFYDINVSAGDITFLDDGLIKGKTPDDWMYIPSNIDADIAFPTYGHSMSPVIANGDRVAYKFINDWSFFNYGMKYLIITDEQRMVKYLRKHNKEGFVLLESENSEYDSIDMPLSSIRMILQVRYIGKTEM